MKTNKIECKVCGKPIISYGFLTSSYWFCSKKCLKKFRWDNYKESPQKKKDGFIAQHKEELKDKINNEFELHRTIFKHKAIFTEKGFNNLKKKILDLIDK